MKYYYEPNDKWYDTKQELVDAWNEDFEGTHSSRATIDSWTEEEWNTIWKPSMKKLEIKTEKATLLVVDLPECKTHLFYKGYYVMDSSDKGLNDKCRKISQGYTQGFYYIGTDCKHLDKVSEITEEEWADITEDGDMTPSSCTYTVGYRDYTIDELTPMFEFDNATESGLSLLKANGVLLENPLGSKPFYDEIVPKKLIKEGYGSNDFVDVLYDLHQWESAQELVWSNPHIFIKTI